ncbi:MAG TPA: YbaB/EbfC family nucleoid-associated protein [Dehalococcoidales bacterium]|nr:YbaB/EbfC family nucleoid-associated protein [Dehalococcoidales bacterium]
MNFNMLRQAQELKSKLDKTQKEMGKMTVEGEAGKGAVKVTMNGQQKIVAIKISPDAVNPNKVGDLEKLIMKAIGDTREKSEKMAAQQLKGLTGGLKIPGLM